MSEKVSISIEINEDKSIEVTENLKSESLSGIDENIHLILCVVFELLAQDTGADVSRVKLAVCAAYAMEIVLATSIGIVDMTEIASFRQVLESRVKEYVSEK